MRERITTLRDVDGLEVLSHYFLATHSFDLTLLDTKAVVLRLIHKMLS
jgi:hypothetical protein